MKVNTEYMYPMTESFVKKNEELFNDSQNITSYNNKLTLFFNNSSMSKLLDIFLDNPHTEIYTIDLLNKTGLSRKAIQVNIPLLMENDIISEEKYSKFKFYKLNSNNSLVKQISQFRNILLVNNVFIPKTPSGKKKQNRRVNTKLQKNRSPGKSKKVPR
jgi:hypothetical protein